MTGLETKAIDWCGGLQVRILIDIESRQIFSGIAKPLDREQNAFDTVRLKDCETIVD